MAKTKQPKYKGKVKVVARNTFQGVCSCSWEGNRLAALDSSMEDTLLLAQGELNNHEHKEK